jgi:hypothetical protein
MTTYTCGAPPLLYGFVISLKLVAVASIKHMLHGYALVSCPLRNIAIVLKDYVLICDDFYIEPPINSITNDSLTMSSYDDL